VCEVNTTMRTSTLEGRRTQSHDLIEIEREERIRCAAYKTESVLYFPLDAGVDQRQ
jgi:hypothetical protein